MYHAFDMSEPEHPTGKEAIKNFNEMFAYAKGHYFAKQMEFVVFDNTSRENKLRKKNWDANLQKAYEFGKGFL